MLKGRGDALLLLPASVLDMYSDSTVENVVLVHMNSKMGSKITLASMGLSTDVSALSGTFDMIVLILE